MKAIILLINPYTVHRPISPYCHVMSSSCSLMYMSNNPCLDKHSIIGIHHHLIWHDLTEIVNKYIQLTCALYLHLDRHFLFGYVGSLLSAMSA